MFVPPKQAEKAAAMKDKQLNDLLARMMQYERVRSYSPLIEVNWILRYHLLVKIILYNWMVLFARADQQVLFFT